MGSSSTETNTEERLLPWQEGPLKDIFARIGPDVLNRPYEFFEGRTFADFAPETLQALEMLGQPGQLAGAGMDELGRTISGEYLSPESNPFFGDLSQAIISQVMPAVQGQSAANYGGGNNPLVMQALGEGVARGVSPFAYGAYGDERNRMMGAISAAPGFESYLTDRLFTAGGVRETQEQRGINEAMQRFGFEQDEPYQRLLRALSIAGSGKYGGTSKSETIQHANPWTTGLGAAMGIGSMALGIPGVGNAVSGFLGLGGGSPAPAPVPGK